MRTTRVRTFGDFGNFGNFRIFDKRVLILWISMMGQVKGQSLRCPSGIDETGTDAFCCRNEFSHLSRSQTQTIPDLIRAQN